MNHLGTTGVQSARKGQALALSITYDPNRTNQAYNLIHLWWRRAAVFVQRVF